MSTPIAQMKVELKYIRPRIWRRFLVDFSISLDELHDTIQHVMGWENCHLYSFTFYDIEYSVPSDGGLGDFGMDFEDSQKTKLNRMGFEPKDKLEYLYDMGDNWEHVIKLEKILEAPKGMNVPFCLGGERNCPPEDCGSFDGYKNIVAAMKSPNSEEAKTLIDWLGEPYDPEHFDLAKINKLLRPKPVKIK